MLSVIEKVNDVVNNFIWGVPAMICIIGVGLLLSFRTGFIQIRKFPYAMKVTLGRMLKKREASDGALTPFQAVCTALAATVGTGNVAGVAGAIAIGGPGAVFWMWISALLGMCTKFSEVTLAVHFHERNANGDLVGGPMYYIKNGLKKHWHWLAYLFSAFGVLTVFGTGNATQVNTITTAIVILCSGVSVGYGEAAGAELTISGFTSTYGGWVSIFTAVAMCCFAFSTIIGWGLYGTRCIEFLFGTKANKPFMVVYSLVAIVGATMNLGLMWSIAETFNGLMVIPNLIAVFLLSGVVVKLVKEYFAGEGAASTLKNSREEAKRTFL
jgi:Na+/alanine symporter